MDKVKEYDIVIIGAGLTGLCLGHYLLQKGKRVIILDKNAQTGGVIQTIQHGDFIYEAGPNTGVLGNKEIVELLEELQPNCKLETANSAAKQRWIWKNKTFNPLPYNLKTAIRTPLFTTRDKLRILGEPFRRRGKNPDESVAEMVKRRLGKSYLEYAVDPFISGIYAGDAEKLITRFALPKLYTLEQEYGSFIRGAIKKKKEKKDNPELKKITREVFSVEGGLGNFISALELKVGSENIQLSCSEVSVNHLSGDYHTRFLNKELNEVLIKSEVVISTADASELNKLFPFINHHLLSPLQDVNYAKVIQAAVLIPNWDGITLNSFGGLIPSKENEEILGILFPSSLFKNRSPEKGATLSVFMGGTKNQEICTKTDSDITKIVLNALDKMLEFKNSDSVEIRIMRYSRAIAQYDNTSEARIIAINALQNEFKGLFLAGSIRDGIGMPDRVKQAKSIAELIE